MNVEIVNNGSVAEYVSQKIWVDSFAAPYVEIGIYDNGEIAAGFVCNRIGIDYVTERPCCFMSVAADTGVSWGTEETLTQVFTHIFENITVAGSPVTLINVLIDENDIAVQNLATNWGFEQNAAVYGTHRLWTITPEQAVYYG